MDLDYEATQKRQQEILDALAKQTLKRQKQQHQQQQNQNQQKTLSLKSNYSETEIILDSGSNDTVDPRTYSLDYSNHAMVNPSYSSSYGTYAGLEQQRQSHTDFDEEQRQSSHTDFDNQYNQYHVTVVDEPPLVLSFQHQQQQKKQQQINNNNTNNKKSSANASYSSYKSFKCNVNQPTLSTFKGHQEINHQRPIWVLTKITRYVTRTIRSEKLVL